MMTSDVRKILLSQIDEAKRDLENARVELEHAKRDSDLYEVTRHLSLGTVTAEEVRQEVENSRSGGS